MTETKIRLLTIGAFIEKKKTWQRLPRPRGGLPSLSPVLPVILALFLALGFGSQGQGATVKGYPHLLFVGDSLTEGYGVASQQAYPHLVAEGLKAAGFPGLSFTNAGSSGATSSFGPKMVAFQLKKRRPDYVIYALGSNDGLRGIDPKATRLKIEQALDLLKAAGVPVLLTGQRAAPNYGPAYTAAFDSLFPAIAKERNLAFYPFLLADVAAKPSLNLPDGIHPNPKGYQVIAKGMIAALIPLLKALPKNTTSSKAQAKAKGKDREKKPQN